MAASNMLASKFKWNMKKQIMHSQNSTCRPEGSGGGTKKFKFRNHPFDFIRSKGWRYKFNTAHLPFPLIALKQLTTKYMYSNIIQQHIRRWDSQKLMLNFERHRKSLRKLHQVRTLTVFNSIRDSRPPKTFQKVCSVCIITAAAVHL